jgi:uncharacterized protein involved in type VI secretion and phage assembly
VTVTPRSRSTDRRFYGLAEAIVVEVEDPDGEDRVKVKFPWFDDAMVTDWCRVAQPYAGNGYGFVFVPEQGDEVLVAFVHGDMRLPIIIGGLYNGQDKPPSARSSSNDQKLIRTKGGHQVLLDDTSGQERVRIETAGGHSADLDDDGKSVTVSSSGGHSVELDDNGQTIKISTSGGAEITLDAAGNSITVSAQSVTIDAQQVALGGSAADQPLVLGTEFLTLFNTHVHTSTLPTVPTSPPVVPLPPTVLSQVSRTK